MGLSEEALAAVPAVARALWPLDSALFAAGEINAVCVGAQPVSSLVTATVPRAYMATKTAAPNRPVSYQSICLVSRRSFSLCALSFCVPNSSPITHVLTAETTGFQLLKTVLYVIDSRFGGTYGFH